MPYWVGLTKMNTRQYWASHIVQSTLQHVRLLGSAMLNHSEEVADKLDHCGGEQCFQASLDIKGLHYSISRNATLTREARTSVKPR